MKQFFKSLVIRLLTLEARLVLAKFRPRIVGVTGTVGKTTTKDAIAYALAPFFRVRASAKSFNSDFGIPLTVLGGAVAGGNPLRWLGHIARGIRLLLLPAQYPEWLVAEIGVCEPGDMERFMRLLRPDIAVFTRFSKVPVHVEFFSSPEALFEEKMKLARAVRTDGALVFSGDDERVRALKEEMRGRRVILYGVSDNAEVRGSYYSVRYESQSRTEMPVGVSFKVDVEGSSFPIILLGAVGEHLMQPVLAAFAVAQARELNLVRVAEALRNFTPPPGRMRLLLGVLGSCIIDDSYNSSPIALAAALETLRSLRPSSAGGRKIAVLGDMMELGNYTVEEHLKAGRRAAGICDVLVTVGARARGFAEGARRAGLPAERVLSFEESRATGRALNELLRSGGDIVLVKGSQAARMERVVKEIMAEPRRAKELLVRQEKEWLKK